MNGHFARPEGGQCNTAAEAGGKKTILLAEDDDGARKVIRETLEESGYSVIEARNGLDALRAVSQHRGEIDLLLTDIVMPGMGGRALAAAMKVARPGARVLYMSAHMDPDFRAPGDRDTTRAFLTKPFTASSLIARIRELLERGGELPPGVSGRTF